MNASFHYECSSCPSEMSAVRLRIRESAAAFGFDEETIAQLVLAVDEACTNIHRYAYEERTDGKIELDVIADRGIWEVRLRDYGKQCDPSKLKSRDLHEIRPGGLGIFFIHKAFDEVHFDRQGKGTCLILRKKCPKV